MTERQSLAAILGGLLLIAVGLGIDAALPFPTELIGDLVAAGGGVVLAMGVMLRSGGRR
ncbi:MAG: hypothetical protein INR64_06860 [Caulobacteraceae bacterium]|nr:hypothetical protein [Caulobacter sp.]